MVEIYAAVFSGPTMVTSFVPLSASVKSIPLNPPQSSGLKLVKKMVFIPLNFALPWTIVRCAPSGASKRYRPTLQDRLIATDESDVFEERD